MPYNVRSDRFNVPDWIRLWILVLRAVCTLMIPSAIFATPVIPAKGGTYEIGFSKVDITPHYPIRLNGYLGRNAESTNAIHPLYAKGMAFGTDKQGPAVLISVDNCIVPRHVYEEVVAR